MIHIDEKNRVFTLYTNTSSYQFAVDEHGFLLHTYYGRRAGGDMRHLLRRADRGFSPNCCEEGHTRTFSLDTQPQEYPCAGTGDYRLPALECETPNGAFAAQLYYRAHRVSKGKYSIPGLPAFYDEGGQADTLEVDLEDPVTGLLVTLRYGVFEEYDLITRAVTVRNGGKEPLRLTRVMSASLDMNGPLDLITFDGAHTQERHPSRRAVQPGMQGVSSVRGTTSHQHNNFVVLCRPDATEQQGDCWGAALVYSGNFEAMAERSQFGSTRLSLGIGGYRFCWKLEPGEAFDAPEAAFVFSPEGLGGMSRRLHRAIRENLCRGYWKHRRRPVLLNTWEAAYFDFDEQKLLEIARCAADTGVELLVMDDGWFGERNDDLRGLGDWFVNTAKLPDGLGELTRRINEMGLRFGIWVEPEMVNEDSDLYRAHPDWALQIPGRPVTRGRSQLVLDFSRPEVRDHVYSQIKAVLQSGSIDYVKWDMNRSLSDAWSAALPADRQGEVYHRFVLGVYDMLERMQADFPQMLIEGCSGGGGRFDCGMLYYTPQIWCSDNTDAIDRLALQHGSSFCYPVSTMGAHVSAVPNEQTGRTVSIETRAVVAMSGTFGYELDPRHLSDEERAAMRAQINRFHALYDLIQYGDYDRLTAPGGSFTAWQHTAPDASQALVSVVTGPAASNPPFDTVYPRGLVPDAEYTVNDSDTLRGDVLMYGGIPLPFEKGDYRAMQFHLVRQG